MQGVRGAAAPAARTERIGGAHGPQLVHQRQRIGVGHHHRLGIDHGQREPAPAAAARPGRARRRTAQRAGWRRPRSPPRRPSKAVLSSASVAPPSMAASSSPSGLKARRTCTSAPGRSLTSCRDSPETTRSSDWSGRAAPPRRPARAGPRTAPAGAPAASTSITISTPGTAQAPAEQAVVGAEVQRDRETAA